MSQVQRREFECDVYRGEELPAGDVSSELYIAATVAFRVYNDGRVRELTTGENQGVQACLDAEDPVREDVLELIQYDNSFYVPDEGCDDVRLGTHYLVDGETIFTPVSKTNMVKDHRPIESITEDEFTPDHRDVYIVQRDNPFGRFRYPTNKVRRFVRSERVAKLAPVRSR